MAFLSSIPTTSWRQGAFIQTCRPRAIPPMKAAVSQRPSLCSQEPPSETSYLLDDSTSQSTLPVSLDINQQDPHRRGQNPVEADPALMPGIVQTTSDLDPRVLFGEFLSTFLFVYLSVNAATSGSPIANSLNNAAVIAAIAVSFMPVSGAHLNPAVTLALAITNRVSLKRAIFFVPVQLLAAAAACSLAMALGVHVPFDGIAKGASTVDVLRAFFAELIPMFIIVVVVFQTAVATEKEGGVGNKLAALYIGLAVLACAGTFTTGMFNPARAFGPALVTKNFVGHWVYWVGPFVGATFAALISEHLFLAPASKRQPNSWLAIIERRSAAMGSRIKNLGVAGIIAYGVLNTLYYGSVFSFMMFKVC